MIVLKTGFGRADMTPPKYHGLGGFGNDVRRFPKGSAEEVASHNVTMLTQLKEEQSHV